MKWGETKFDVNFKEPVFRCAGRCELLLIAVSGDRKKYYLYKNITDLAYANTDEFCLN